MFFVGYQKSAVSIGPSPVCCSADEGHLMPLFQPPKDNPRSAFSALERYKKAGRFRYPASAKKRTGKINIPKDRALSPSTPARIAVSGSSPLSRHGKYPKMPCLLRWSTW